MDKILYWMFFIGGLFGVVGGLITDDTYLLCMGSLLWIIINSLKVGDLEEIIRTSKPLRKESKK